MAIYNLGPSGEQDQLRIERTTYDMNTKIRRSGTFGKVGSEVVNTAFTDQVRTLGGYTQEECVAEIAKRRLEVRLGRPVLDSKIRSTTVRNTIRGLTFSFSTV